MTKERASLGFGDTLTDFNPEEWQPDKDVSRKEKMKPDQTSKAAKTAGFTSREPKLIHDNGSQPKKKSVRRRRTGRNVQLNIKAKQETVDAYFAIADANDWGLGETLEKAVELMKKTYGQ